MKVNRHSCVYIYKLSIDIKQYIYIYVLNCYKNRFNCYKKEKKKVNRNEEIKNKIETTVVCVSIYIYFFIIIYYLKYGNFDSTKCIGKISK